MNPKEIAITEFDYPLAQEDIAQYPLEERDHSKLLVYKKHKVSHHFYHQLPEHLIQHECNQILEFFLYLLCCIF
jgi:S-adenosylmethionine:tRNA ribosyltransferase-isomerase